MNENEFLNFLINKVAIEASGIAIVSIFDLEEFGVNDVVLFENLNLLAKTNQATHLRCLECSETCFAPVTIYPKNQFSPETIFITCKISPETIFITCKNGMGRTHVNLHDLNQWQTSARQIAQVVAKLYGHSKTPTEKNGQWQIGLVEGQHTGMLLLDFHADDGVQCIVNEQSAALVEVMTFNGKNFKLDVERLKKMVTTSAQIGGISIKREVQKAATQALYSVWNQEYIKMKREHPKYNDEKISDLISKLTVGNGKSPEYIRRNMKTKK